MKVQVCVPSYKRPKVETLDYLPFARVYVDNKEYDEYAKANPKGSDIVAVPDGIQGNLCRIRNYILDTEFSNGADVVCIIDDDMRKVCYWEGRKRVMLKAEEWEPFLQKYSLICKELGAFFWGINITPESQVYREYAPFSTVSYIGGPFQCHLSGSEIRYDENFPLKEDYDITIQHLNKYRKVFRVNKFYYVVKQSAQSGGCAMMRNLEVEKRQLEALQRKWGKKIVTNDVSDRAHLKRKKGENFIDYNPIIRIPIKGI